MWLLCVRDLVNQLLKWFCRCWVNSPHSAGLQHERGACTCVREQAWRAAEDFVPSQETLSEEIQRWLHAFWLLSIDITCIYWSVAAKDQVMAVSPSFTSAHPQVCLPLLFVAVGIYKTYRTCIVLQTSILAAKFRRWMGFKLLGRRHPRIGV